MKRIYFTAIAQTKQGIVLKEQETGNRVVLKWDDFAKSFKETDGPRRFYCEFDESIEQEVHKTQERLEWLSDYAYWLLKATSGNTPSLEDLSMLGHISSEYFKKFGLNAFDLAQDIKLLRAMLTGKLELA